jgi:hypothetical protein
MRRTGLLPIILGIIVGLLGGLYYSWIVNPVEYVQTSPASLREDYRQDFLTLIAAAYANTNDLTRARTRLAWIPELNPATTLSQLAQTRLAAGRPQSETQALAMLAAALGVRPSPLAPGASTLTPSSTAPIPTSTPTITQPPPPTRTPTATPGAPFELLEKEKVCDPDLAGPLIQIEVLDAAGRPVPGVEAMVVWDTGQDHFFTGLKPELGIGYGDFTMSQGLYYTLQLVDSDVPLTGLYAEDCVGEGGELYLGSWLLTFQQPLLP